jgi:hypothetical protein
MSGDNTTRYEYLERVEAAARGYVELPEQPPDGPGYASVRDVKEALEGLIAAVRGGREPAKEGEPT